MALYRTVRFGAVEYSDEAVVEFAEGLPAFESDTRFVLIERAETAPVVFLQSLVHPELCFVTLPVASIDPCYTLSIPAEELRVLGVGDEIPPDDPHLLCLAIVTLREASAPTVNLMAPIVIHRLTRRACQFIQREPGYSFDQPLGVSAC